MDEINSIQFLDDEDFDIPHSVQPSIDQVLNNLDDEKADIFENDSLTITDSHSFDFESFCMGSLSRHQCIVKETISDQTFTLSPIRGLSQILNQHKKLFNVGNLETIIKSRHFFAIGTSHSYVIVFDEMNKLRCCLGCGDNTQIFGCITSIDIDPQEELLVAGHFLGYITVWSLQKERVIVKIEDFVSLKLSVVTVKFSSNSKIIFMTDSQGSLFQIIYPRITPNSKPKIECLHSGFNGEISSVEPLFLHDHDFGHLKKHCLVAITALDRNSVLGFSETYKQIMMTPFEKEGKNLAIARWIVPKDLESPVLLLHGKNQTFYVVSVEADSDKKRTDNVNFKILRQFEFNYSVCFLAVVNEYSLFTLDSLEVFHHVDYKIHNEISTCDARGRDIVYQSSFFKFSSDSQSCLLENCCDQACYYSFSVLDDEIVCLGRNGLFKVEIFTVRQRIENLMTGNKHREALYLTVANYEGRDGPWKEEDKLSPNEIGDVITKCIKSMYKSCPTYGNISHLQEFYYDIVPFAITCCLSTNTISVLFGAIYSLFSTDLVSLRVYLDCLDNYILNKQIDTIPVEITQNFLDYYTEVGLVRELEECLISLNIISIDIDKAMKFAWKYEAYSVMIYIYNEALNDYITPAKLLLGILHRNLAENNIKESLLSVGNKTLLYFSTCLTGKKFPSGYIERDLALRVKDEIFRYLILIKDNQAYSEPTIWGLNEKVLYPNIRILIKYDIQAFFNVLSIVFDDEDFRNSEGISKRQIIIDILFSIMIEMDLNYSPSDLSVLFTFVAQQLAKSPGSLFISRSLLDQVLEFLTVEKFEDGQHYGRQQALLNLIESNEYAYFNDKVLLERCWGAKFYEICEVILLRLKNYSRIFLCYLLDDLRRGHVFVWITEALSCEDIPMEEKRLIREQILENIRTLFSISAMTCTELSLFDLDLSCDTIAELIGEDDHTLLAFFDCLCTIREREALTSGLVMWTNKFELSSELAEMYFELLCKHRPNDVIDHLRYGRATLYHFEAIFALTKKYRIYEAEAFLHEKIGSIEKGYDVLEQVMMNDMEDLFQKLRDSTCERRVIYKSGSYVIPNSLNVLLSYLSRNRFIEESRKEKLWFSLFKYIYTFQKGDFMSEDGLKYAIFCFNVVLKSLSSCVSLISIFRRFLAEDGGQAEMRNLRLLLGDLLSLYNYEEKTMRFYSGLMHSNLSGLMWASSMKSKKPVVVKTNSCNVCNLRITDDGDYKINVFRCGHVVHEECASECECGGQYVEDTYTIKENYF